MGPWAGTGLASTDPSATHPWVTRLASMLAAFPCAHCSCPEQCAPLAVFLTPPPVAGAKRSELADVLGPETLQHDGRSAGRGWRYPRPGIGRIPGCVARLERTYTAASGVERTTVVIVSEAIDGLESVFATSGFLLVGASFIVLGLAMWKGGFSRWIGWIGIVARWHPFWV